MFVCLFPERVVRPDRSLPGVSVPRWMMDAGTRQEQSRDDLCVSQPDEAESGQASQRPLPPHPLLSLTPAHSASNHPCPRRSRIAGTIDARHPGCHPATSLVTHSLPGRVTRFARWPTCHYARTHAHARDQHTSTPHTHTTESSDGRMILVAGWLIVVLLGLPPRLCE